MGEIADVVVDCLDEEAIVDVLESWGEGRLVMDTENPAEPFLDEDGFLTVRFRDPKDIYALANLLERKVSGLRVVEIADPTRPEEPGEPLPGSAKAQRQAGLVSDGPL